MGRERKKLTTICINYEDLHSGRIKRIDSDSALVEEDTRRSPLWYVHAATVAYLSDNQAELKRISLELERRAISTRLSYERLIAELEQVKKAAEVDNALAEHIKKWLADPGSYRVVMEFFGASEEEEWNQVPLC
jgi:hypothetical protein